MVGTGKRGRFWMCGRMLNSRTDGLAGAYGHTLIRLQRVG